MDEYELIPAVGTTDPVTKLTTFEQPPEGALGLIEIDRDNEWCPVAQASLITVGDFVDNVGTYEAQSDGAQSFKVVGAKSFYEVGIINTDPDDPNHFDPLARDVDYTYDAQGNLNLLALADVKLGDVVQYRYYTTAVAATVSTLYTANQIAPGSPAGTLLQQLQWLAANGGGTVTPAPTITGFLPMSGARGSTVVLTGTGFTGATVVSINSAAVGSFVVDSATQITAVLSGSQATGKVRVTTPAGTAVSANDFTVTTAAPTFTSYAPADQHWQDGAYKQPQTTGSGFIRNTFASVRGTITAVSGTQLRVTVNSQYNAFGNPTRPVGLYLNGSYQRLNFPVNSTTALTVNVPSGSVSLRIVFDDVARTTVGQVDVNGDSLVNVECTAPISWQAATAPARRVVFGGDSITGGGIATEPIKEAFAVLVRDALAQATTVTRLTVDSYSGGSLNDVYGPQADRLAYRTRLYAQLDGTVSNDLAHFYGTNDDGRNASTGAQYAANYAQLLDDIRADRPDVHHFIVTPFPVTASYATTLENEYRVPLRQVLSTRPWATLVEGPSLVTPAYLVGDGVHFNTPGHAQIANGLLAMLGSNVPNLSAAQNMELDGNNNALSLLKLTTNLTDPEYAFNGSAWQTSNTFNVRNVVRGDYEIKVRSQSVPTRLRTQTIRVGQTYFITDPKITVSPNWNNAYTPTESPFQPHHPGSNDAQHYVEFAYDGPFQVYNRIQPNVQGMMLQKQDGAPNSTPFGVSVPTSNPSFGPSLVLTYTHPAEPANVMRLWGSAGDPDWFFGFIILY